MQQVDGPSPMVLIVEDERVSRRALATLLGHSGFATTAVGSAEEALVVLAQGASPKIALIDLDLPGMSGAELIARLARLDKSVIPIVISAANDDRLIAATRARGVSFLRKPLNFEDLLSLLSEVRFLH